MKTNWKTRFFALLLCAALLATCFPLTAFAEEAETAIDMVAGDSIVGFVPAGTDCESTDMSVAWVDSNGSLNAMKAGTATVSVYGEDESQTDYTVNVSDYSDGSEIVGNLKILARYNDNMQFYDGHVYLLFTSYQDGVTVSVPDLYAGYRISDNYYKDIKEDISNGSNHTGNDAEKYFTFDDEMTSVTLDRGEIVTIGMYRDFDLSVPQAALGSIKNSSLWNDLVKEGKSGVIETIFKMLDTGEMKFDIAIERIKAILEEEGLDYNRLLDGVVDGGVCFNRELYNQKLEWDQYENVTYEKDITANQLYMMQMYLRGNLNHFSILKNSCATVALRAWNGAVGTDNNGEPNAYYLDPTGEGVFAVVDAPKTVRDSIRDRLPGYYLNNAEGVEEPDAGYQDDTGWVYVSAPEKVSDVEYTYANDDIVIDESKTKPVDIFNSAKGGNLIPYNKDEQQVGIEVKTSSDGELTTVESIDFDVNGMTVSCGADTVIEGGVWFKTWIGEPDNGDDQYVVDADGKALASEYADGWISFYAPALPISFRIVGSDTGAQNILRTVVVNGNDKIETKVFTVTDGEESDAFDILEEVAKGTKVYVISSINDKKHVLSDITVNGESIYDENHYDDYNSGYFFTMPGKYSVLTVKYDTAVIKTAGKYSYQMMAGESFDAADFMKLYIGADETESDAIASDIQTDRGVLEQDGNTFTAVKEGTELIHIFAVGNHQLGTYIGVDVFADRDEAAQITFSDETGDNMILTAEYDGNVQWIQHSGTYVKKGSVLSIEPDLDPGKAVMFAYANNDWVEPGEKFTVDEDTEIKVKAVDAVIEGMPEEIQLNAKGDTYQLEPQIKYSGVYGAVPVYDKTVEYTSGDENITVDENGLITVTGDVPEEGLRAYVYASAGSANVTAVTKITVGDYAGDKIVGSLTIHARRIDQGELVAHGCVTFTTYEDLDLDTSFYEYYQPDDRYNDYMIDYEQHPENYTSDPALYSMNELGLEDRGSYFTIYSHGKFSEPQTISLLAGETITVSNYGFDSTNITAVCEALKGSTLYQDSAECQALVYEMEQYIQNSENYEGSIAFDALAATLMQIFTISRQTGYNPADGDSEGGMCINRELYNQFRRNDTQLPNNYYTVEITADELAVLKAYLADSGNNCYSFMAKNCATGAVDIWNSVLSDKPELQLNGNLTGVAVDPQSLYFDIGALTAKDAVGDYDGHGGTDFYPRTVRYSDATKDAIDKIKAIGTVDASDECKEKIDAAREAYDALNDSEKERVWNYDDLVAAEAAYDLAKLAEDKAKYAAHQENTVALIDWFIADEDDSAVCQKLTETAKAAITARPYDEGQTLDENKAAVDTILMIYIAALAKQRYIENPFLGDVDLDGSVTIADVVPVQRTLAWIEQLPAAVDPVADTDQDGAITVMDVSMTQRWLAYLKSNDNIGKPLVQKDQG